MNCELLQIFFSKKCRKHFGLHFIMAHSIYYYNKSYVCIIIIMISKYWDMMIKE